MNAAGNTCAAVLTPPGAGAIAIVRVVGPDAVSIVDGLFRTRGGKPLTAYAPGRLVYGSILAGDQPIDDAVVTRASPAPAAAVDICAHGGVRVVERILHALQECGAAIEQAGPGVGNLWPVENLIQAEALDTLRRAKTTRAVHFLAYQYRHLAAAVDALPDTYRTRPEETADALRRMMDGCNTAATLIDGATVAILGPPNSGKSTLFNQLVGRTAAVVSPRAGTTRDWVVETVEMDGLPIALMDTAGWHGAGDLLEEEAIGRSLEVGRATHARILVLDGSQPLPVRDLARIAELTSPSVPSLVVVNKSDLARAWAPRDLPGELADLDRVELSALTGAGVQAMVNRTISLLRPGPWNEFDACLFTARQRRVAERVLARPGVPALTFAAGIAELIGKSPGPAA